MNSWIKAIFIISGVFCALALGALGWLAVQTTDVPDARSAKPLPAWEKPLRAARGTASTGRATLPDIAVVPDLAAQVDELTKRLLEIGTAGGAVPGELLLSFKSPEALGAFRARAGLAGIEILQSDPRLLSARVRYRDAEAMARELRDHARDYDNIGLNYLAWVPGLPQTPTETDTTNAGGRQPFGNSGLEAIGATGDRSTWGRGVTVAVLDTGVTDHSTLKQTQVTHVDLVKDGQAPNGHGTAMASLIAGNDSENGGVAIASKLLDIRVADASGESNTGLVAQGIMQAVDQGARVINISLGTTGDSAVLRRAVEYAQSRGVVIVAAAGNEQQTTLAYPASYEGVISVGAADATDAQAYFSNSGENLTLVAPGVGIVSGYSDDRMVISSGTSQATAITSGVVSTLISRGWSAAGVEQALTSNARETGAPANQVGAGILQVPTR